MSQTTQTWYIMNGDLWYNNKIVCNYSSYKKKLQIKTSDDCKYCAVFDDNDMYCDFYTEFENNSKYMFTLRRYAKYGPDSHMIVEFFTYNNNQYFLFHEQYDHIDVRDMNNNIIVRKNTNSEFIQSLHKVNNDFYVIKFWIWHPEFGAKIFNVKKLIEDKDDENNFQCIWWQPSEYGIYQHSLYKLTIKNEKIHYDEYKNLPVFELKKDCDCWSEYLAATTDSEEENNEESNGFFALEKGYKKYEEHYEFNPEYVLENCTTNELFKIFIKL